MATLYKCDRCGTILEAKDDAGYFKVPARVTCRGVKSGDERCMDLCEKCFDGLSSYLDNEKVTITITSETVGSVVEEDRSILKKAIWRKKCPGGYVYE